MRRGVAAALLLAQGPVALSHHSFAMFDMQKDVSLSGTVKSFAWQSPHSWLQVMVPDEAGRELEWSVEMGAPGMLYRQGWRQDSVRAGDKVTVVIHPLRDGRPGGSLVILVLPDGKKLGQRGSGSTPAASLSEPKP